MKHLILALGLLAASAVTSAHVSLESREAVAGSTYKGVLRVPHGCAGSTTTAIRVLLPAGFSHAKPMPKAGWQLDTVQQNGDVREIIWHGGKLPDAYYDEFVFRGTLPASAGQTAWFKVIQQCEQGETRWETIPQDGKEGDTPATGVKLLPAAATAHIH